jgi:hypothetical protein
LRRDIIVGVALGLVIYLAFTRVLGVRLPAGLLTGIFEDLNWRCNSLLLVSAALTPQYCYWRL